MTNVILVSNIKYSLFLFTGIFLRLTKCFSLSSNLSKLVASTQNDRNIACLNGLRVISMMWVILGHTFSFAILGLPFGKIHMQIIYEYSC